jgi:hypothetical protein
MQNFSLTPELISIRLSSGIFEDKDVTEVNFNLKLDSPRGMRATADSSLERTRWILSVGEALASYGSNVLSTVGVARRIAPKNGSEGPITYLVQVQLHPVQFSRFLSLTKSKFSLASVEFEIDGIELEGFDVAAWGSAPDERPVANFEAKWEIEPNASIDDQA